jgi:hypothetical protein
MAIVRPVQFQSIVFFLDNYIYPIICFIYFVDRRLCIRLYDLLNQDMGQDMNKVFRDLDSEFFAALCNCVICN